MKTSVFLFALLVHSFLFAADRRADFYCIDTGLGNATLIVSPSGESLLLDTGTIYSAGRVWDVLKQAGLTKLDYLLVTHYHDDHFGAAVTLAEKLPVVTFVDHGASVETGKSDEWWMQRRAPWYKPGKGKLYDDSFDAYAKARDKAHHLVVKAGDKVPIAGLDVQIVIAAGKPVDQPLAGAGAANPAEGAMVRPVEDDAEDAQSIGVLITFGKFRFIYLGDLSWNESLKLFTPIDKVGPVDAYVVTHHAQSFPREMGDYYWGLSACPPLELRALRPRVALLSLSTFGHKGGDDKAIKTVLGSQGLEDLWQTEKIRGGGEAGSNAPDDFIANTNLGGRGVEARFIKLSASEDAGFEVTNSRNGFTRKYPPKH